MCAAGSRIWQGDGALHVSERAIRYVPRIGHRSVAVETIDTDAFPLQRLRFRAVDVVARTSLKPPLPIGKADPSGRRRLDSAGCGRGRGCGASGAPRERVGPDPKQRRDRRSRKRFMANRPRTCALGAMNMNTRSSIGVCEFLCGAPHRPRRQ